MSFLIEADRLKEVLRRTVTSKSRRPENSAEHSWHIVLFAMTLAEHAAVPVDLARVLRMLAVHDLVEIDAGDTFAYDTAGMAGQHDREARAADRIFGLLPPDQAAEFRGLWDEFEARATPEARFALACDRFQAMVLNVRTEGHAWRQHGITHDRVMARNAAVRDGSQIIWEYAEQMIREAVAAGHLSPAK
ncbi:MAG TPA: HD domain-containing protein [Candidatus Didemnitutus sp.]|nr:HD domain-containing protein [Candidatus Didemnitutus sp.]